MDKHLAADNPKKAIQTEKATLDDNINPLEQHQAWLDKMTVQSKQKQEQFITNISQRLGHPRMKEAPKHPYRGAPAFWQELNWSTEQCVEQFTANFNAVGGHVSRFATLAEAANFIANKAAELGAKKIVRQDERQLADLCLEQKLEGNGTEVLVWNNNQKGNWKAEAAQADFGIVQAEHAVAYTGSVVVKSSEQKGRSVSLLPTVLFVIIPESTLVTRLGEVLKQFDKEGRTSLPAGIHFISGPSRSSDIENDLTIGVHGPGVVFALIVKNA